MVVQTRPLAEVTQTAIRVLCREIGLADTMRFVGQFTVGWWRPAGVTAGQAGLPGGRPVVGRCAQRGNTPALGICNRASNASSEI
jgi:hypothetical protein